MNTNQNRRFGSRHQQRGFGMALALAVLAIFAVIAGAISLANKGGTTKTDQENAKVMAQSIINRGNEIFSAALRGSQDRTLSKMVLSPTSTVGTNWGLYDPSFELTTDVAMPAKGFSTGTPTSFALDSTNVKITGLNSGSDAIAISAVVPSVTPAACAQINRMLNGEELDTAPPTVSAAAAITVREGCATIGTVLTYYKVLGSSV